MVGGGWCYRVLASSVLQFGALREVRHARGREHCRREPGSARSGGYTPDSARTVRSSTSQGSAEPLSTRIKGANWEISERKADL